ncbi:hypothetical protein [Actinoplanes rectilineatus]|uniref:hypothetical protein n=1 Tax=Actinoplanes rectilineatus TaxID=113571 RepID=UPI0005F2977B|nr:hypothetical protein [Actinoplanes rectilineatus]
MPDLKAIDLIYSHEGQYGWTVRSPQVPGLTGGRETDLDLDADVPSMLSFAGVDPGSVEIRTHIERTVPVIGDEITIRVARDIHRAAVALNVAEKLVFTTHFTFGPAESEDPGASTLAGLGSHHADVLVSGDAVPT